jgi:hypothetical protein
LLRGRTSTIGSRVPAQMSVDQLDLLSNWWYSEERRDIND